MSEAAVDIGPFQKRAKRIISNSALYDLVEDVAAKVDDFHGRLHSMDHKLDTIMEILRAKAE